MGQKKEVKTLLLCKITSEEDHSQIYNNLYPPKEQIEAARYITLGGFDATVVYSTPNTTDNKWLQSTLEDNENIIRSIDNQKSYHPIHLVRYVDENTVVEKHVNDERFLLVTFVYGVNPKFVDIENNEGEWIIDNDSGSPVSFKKGNKKPASNVTIEVYQCINISDRVIFTYTDSISSALEAVFSMEATGMAKKTYSTIHLLMGDDGKIHNKTLKNLKKQANLGVSISGSIKNVQNWKTIKDDITSKFKNQMCSINIGEDDFIIMAKASGEELYNLLSYYLEKSSDISKACWDIRTELQWEYKSSSANNSKSATYILKTIESEYRTKSFFHLDNLEDPCDWKYPLKELIAAQNNIDQNPLLRGPAYLLWDCFTILNQYFSGKVTDVHNCEQMICESRESIERFIRCLSQLTDQLIRNDDIIFRGLGCIPAISTSIPENLLEIYHAFLRKLADDLINIDGKSEYVKKTTEKEYDYEYGFLIAPELNQRARICQVFKSELRYKKSAMYEVFRSWPSRQVYIIQIPIGDIYNPVQCLIPLVHECFHFFGDKLRLRRERAFYITLFLAEAYVEYYFAALGISGVDPTKHAMVEKAREILGTAEDGQSGIDSDIRNNNEDNLYYDRLQEKLLKGFNYLLSDEGTRRLYESVKSLDISPALLYYLDTIKLRKENESRFLSAPAMKDSPVGMTGQLVVETCRYYFRECYSDFMTISVLDLYPEEYLQAFEKELLRANLNDKNSVKELKNETGLVTICQRIAIVLAANTPDPDKESKYSSEDRKDIIDNIHNAIRRMSVSNNGAYDTKEIVTKCYDALIDDSNQPLQPKGTENGYEGVFPIASMRTVVEYLKDVYKSLPEDVKIEKSSLKNLFNDLIRNEEMFVPQLPDDDHDLVIKNRKRINKKVDPNEGNKY